MLETSRLSLAPWEERHWVDLQPIAADPEVMRHISGKPWPEERIREFVGRQVDCFAERGFCMWRAIDKSSGVLAGLCGIQPLRGTGEIEIGWWLAQSQQGRGLATEAARAVLADAFGRVGLTRLVAIARPANRLSLRVMEKLGMRFERNWLYSGVPVVLYAVERSGPAAGPEPEAF